MANILDYIKWRGDLSMDSAPFNELDGLVLARLSYAPFDKIDLQRAAAPVSVQDAALALLKTPDLERSVLWKYDVDLLAALSENDRFRNMQLVGYVNHIDDETQTQFSAVTIRVRDGLHYVSFRGTDDTLVGWKEDFNMSFICPVPAQTSSVAYLERMADACPGTLILGGHSKGGNLAVYSSVYCRPEIQDRIRTIYSFDGPGFDESVLRCQQYGRISGKTAAFIPQSSVVGMLLEHEEDHIIVKSTERSGLLQHDIYSWEVERDHLCYLDTLTDRSRFIDGTLKGWVADMDAAQRETFVDALYAIVSQTNARTLRDLSDHWFESASAILSSLKDLDEPTRKLILQSLSLLVKNAKESMREVY